MKYTSSIMSKYGDVDNVLRDVKVLREIFNRQGASLLIDVLAERNGEIANRFRMSALERTQICASLCEELKQAILERI